MILDAGFLISVDRSERAAYIFDVEAKRAGVDLHTTAPVVAQVWRNGVQQALLARFLKAVTVHEFDPLNSRQVGELLGAAGTSDVVDAHLVVTAQRLGMDVLTGDPSDIGPLTAAIKGARPLVKVWP